MSQLDFVQQLWPPASTPPASLRAASSLAIDAQPMPDGTLWIQYVRHPRARRYRLALRRDGTARCTVPRRGTLVEARRFVAHQESWLRERWRVHRAEPTAHARLEPGSRVWLRGEELPVELGSPEIDGSVQVRLGDLSISVPSVPADLRPILDRMLRLKAVVELRQRAMELAQQHDLSAKVRQVSVRNQRTRWGSCSARGVISLNWRLLQVPPSVRDYVILHELAHLKHLNHSARFWAEVERLCPTYADAEAWLKRSGRRVL